MKFIIQLFVITLLFFSCQNTSNSKQETPKAPTITTPLNFLSQAINLKSKLCDNAEPMECANANVNYYLAQDGEEKIRNKINNSIHALLFNNLMMSDTLSATQDDLQKAAESFISDYDSQINDENNQGYVTPFSNETECKILYDSEKIVCFSCTNYTNTGGAHPNYFTELINFDKQTGERISSKNILKDKQQLSPILEKQAKAHYRVEEGQSLKDVGLTYEGDEFPVIDNIGILKDSIILEYNPYEVGPYVLGGITFKIAKKEIQDLLLLK